LRLAGRFRVSRRTCGAGSSVSNSGSSAIGFSQVFRSS
jgi:hypothetical protein